MATTNAIAVALFNAAAGGYAKELETNGAAIANTVGIILEKDISTDALFVEHLLSNFGVSATDAVYAEAKAGLTGLLTAGGRLSAATKAVDFLKGEEGKKTAFGAIADAFAAKVAKATAFSTANATERDITKLISGVTGVDTDAAAVEKAAADAKAAAEKVAADAAAKATAAADAAAKTAAEALAAEKTASKTAADAAAKAAADAKTAADKVAADLKTVDDTTYATEQAAFDAAAKKAADAAAALKVTTDAAAKAAADEIAALKAQIDALQNPAGKSFALTNSTTADVLVGTTGSDTFTGASGTVANTDVIQDSSSTDSDTANLVVTGDFGATGDGASIRITGVEKVNVTVNATAAKDVYANSFEGVQTLTVTRGDITVGGSTIKGDKSVSVLELDATQVANVVAGTGTKAFSLTYAADTANTGVYTGATVDASKAIGNVTITGPVTLTAGTTGTSGTVSVQGTATAAQNTGVVSVTAPTAVIVNVGNTTATTGAVTINAVAAHTVAASVAGGGSITALGGISSDSKGITVTAIDDSGITVTTSYVGTKSSSSDKSGAITLTGGAGSVDAATVSANGVVTLTQTDVDVLNLSGNTAAVDYIVGSVAATKITASGSKNVTIRDSADNLNGRTITKALTDGATLTVNIDAAVSGAESLSKVQADLFVFSADANSSSTDTLTFATGASLSLAKDQTALGLVGATAKSTINIATADDTSASGAVIDISVGALTLSSTVTTLNITADVGSLTATSTALASTSAAVVVTGSEDVTFGAITNGKSLNASGSSGVISLSTASTTFKTITTGAGDDDITVSGAAAYTINAGEGDNTVTVSSGVADGTNVSTGSGSDTITVTDASALVIVTGDGGDTVNINVDASNAILALGAGTDSVVFDGVYDLSGQADFAMIDVEEVDVTAGDVTISAASFANDTKFKLIGDLITDELKIVNTGTSGVTLDASGITFASSQNAALSLQGLAAKQDIITGSAKNDTIVATSGGDVVAGGAGVDLYVATALAAATIEGTGTGTSQGVVINLGSSAVTNTTVLSRIDVFTATSVTSVAAGTVAYTFAASASTNSAVTSTVSGIESATGTSGRDYIVASPAGGGTITGAAGADYMVAGAGVDTFVVATADTGITVATADYISGFATASDKLSLGVAGASANYLEIAGVNGDTLTDVLVDVNAAMDSTVGYVFVYGLDILVATGGADAADGALFIDSDLDGTADDMIVLVGAGTAAFLALGNIIV